MIDKDEYKRLIASRFTELLELKRSEGVSVRAFIDSIEIPSSSYFKALRDGEKLPGSYILMKILQRYPEVNPAAFFDIEEPILKNGNSPKSSNAIAQRISLLPADARNAVVEIIDTIHNLQSPKRTDITPKRTGEV